MKTPSLYKTRLWLLNVFLTTFIKREGCGMRGCRGSNEVSWLSRQKCVFCFILFICCEFGQNSLLYPPASYFVSLSSSPSESDSVLFCMLPGNKYSIMFISSLFAVTASHQHHNLNVLINTYSSLNPPKTVLELYLMCFFFLKVFKASLNLYHMQKVICIYYTVVKLMLQYITYIIITRHAPNLFGYEYV